MSKKKTNRDILKFIQDHHTHLMMINFKRKLYKMLNDIKKGEER